jgi:division protein CdvB (Snf7/Vps24/ESCRT-III family)
MSLADAAWGKARKGNSKGSRAVSATPVAVPDEAVIQILRSAVESAGMELDSATTAAAKTFGASQDAGHKTTPAAESSSANSEPAPIKPTKKSKGEAIEDVDADVVQLRPQRGAI